MRTIIPIAGKGTRLRPHTYALPKSMMKVAGKPILQHIMDTALSYGAEEFTLIVNEFYNPVREFVSTHYTHPVQYRIQTDFTGIAAALLLAEEELKKSEPALIILGDTIFTADIASVVKDGHTSIGVKEVDDPRRLGIAELDGDGFVTRLIEKPQAPKSNLALVGVYYIRDTRELLHAIRELIQRNITTKGEFQITDAFQLLVENGEKMRTFKLSGWYDCGTFESFLESNQYLVSLNPCRKKYETAVIVGNNYIADSAVIENSVIGPHVSISENVIIRNSVLRNCLIDDNSVIQSMMIGDSIIGANVTLTGSPKSMSVADSSFMNDIQTIADK